MGSCQSGGVDGDRMAKVFSMRPKFGLQDQRTVRAVKKFNKGLTKEVLVDLGLRDNPRAAAAWLHHASGVDCALLGHLLGDPAETQLMEAYVHKLELRGITLDQALRRLLKGFRLPGEAQKIDRLMDSFAKYWCASQNDSSATLRPDIAYVVAFALIMLNTDLHNPSVKRKMTLQDFQRSLAGIDSGADLSAQWVAELYEGIKTKEIVLEHTFTERRKPAAMVSDLDADMLKRLHLKARFKGGVDALMVARRLSAFEHEPQPLVLVPRKDTGARKDTGGSTLLEAMSVASREADVAP
jgi:hypothetical protein